MARFDISKKDGTTSPYFWTDRDGSEETRKRVYKQTADGIKRMKGVRFDSVANRLRKD